MLRAFARSTFAFVISLALLSQSLNAQDSRPPLNARDMPPRIELGAVLSATSQSDIGNYFHVGGGGRVTVNATRYLAGEVEATRQPTDTIPGFAPELHSAIAAKATYRAEQARWLKVAGLNFFGVAGPAFLNRTVEVLGGGCALCGGNPLQRQTAAVLDWGGGFEVVPTRALAVRFDVTHASFSEPVLYSSQTVDRHRTYIKVAVMVRVP